MGEREAFLSRIFEDPLSDTHRLVFADWLDEHGEHDRAAFVRAQVERAAAPERARAWELDARLAELLPRVTAGGWGGGIDQTVDAWEFRRGFVGHIELTRAAFDWRAATVFRAHPVVSVRLTDAHPRDFRGGWYWTNFDRVTGEPWFLLDAFTTRLTGYDECEGSVNQYFRYATAAAALADLSDACVNSARNAVGLPALPPTRPPRAG